MNTKLTICISIIFQVMVGGLKTAGSKQEYPKHNKPITVKHRKINL